MDLIDSSLPRTCFGPWRREKRYRRGWRSNVSHSRTRGGIRPIKALAIAILLAIAGFHGATLAAEELRIWTSIDGRTIKASFASVDHGSNLVTLRLAEGREIQYPLTHLSDEDRKWIRETSPPLTHDYSRRLNRLIAGKAAGDSPASPAVLRWMEMKEALENEATFVVWIYEQLLGRIPEPAEFARFTAEEAPDKRTALIEELMESPGYDEHFIESFLAELLQVDGREPEATPFTDCPEPIADYFQSRRPNPNPEAYRQWVADQVRLDRPWTELVKEALTTNGRYSENPAGGYLLVDSGLEVVDAARMMTAFAGVEMTCARCHDHPWVEVYQMDYFRLAAYFAELEFTTINTGTGNGEVALVDNPDKTLRLPADYKYVDGEAGMRVSAASFFGERIDPGKSDSLREGFADWLTAESNPRFTINIANRLWKHIFGLAPIEPPSNLPGHLDEAGADLDILNRLSELVVEKEHRLKEVLKILYGTEVFVAGSAEAGGIEARGERVDDAQAVEVEPVLEVFGQEGRAPGLAGGGGDEAVPPGKLPAVLDFPSELEQRR